MSKKKKEKSIIKEKLITKNKIIYVTPPPLNILKPPLQRGK